MLERRCDCFTRAACLGHNDHSSQCKTCHISEAFHLWCPRLGDNDFKRTNRDGFKHGLRPLKWLRVAKGRKVTGAPPLTCITIEPSSPDQCLRMVPKQRVGSAWRVLDCDH